MNMANTVFNVGAWNHNQRVAALGGILAIISGVFLWTYDMVEGRLDALWVSVIGLLIVYVFVLDVLIAEDKEEQDDRPVLGDHVSPHQSREQRDTFSGVFDNRIRVSSDEDEVLYVHPFDRLTLPLHLLRRSLAEALVEVISEDRIRYDVMKLNIVCRTMVYRRTKALHDATFGVDEESVRVNRVLRINRMKTSGVMVGRAVLTIRDVAVGRLDLNRAEWVAAVEAEPVQLVIESCAIEVRSANDLPALKIVGDSREEKRGRRRIYCTGSKDRRMVTCSVRKSARLWLLVCGQHTSDEPSRILGPLTVEWVKGLAKLWG